MAADSRSPSEPTGQGAESVKLHGEEETSGEATPRKDLAGAILVAIVSSTVMAASLRLDVPDTRFTAPGLLPFITGLALLAMSLVLGLRAVRAGALSRTGTPFSKIAMAYLRSSEERRAWLLGAIVLAYVILVAQLDFELTLPFVGYVISTYEIVSVLLISLVLKLFWRASLLRCILAALLGVEFLALAFRFGFNMLMPQVF